MAGLLPVDRHHHFALSGFDITFQMEKPAAFQNQPVLFNAYLYALSLAGECIPSEPYSYPVQTEIHLSDIDCTDIPNGEAYRMALEIQRIRYLPTQEFTEILAESKMAGFRAIDRLVTDWETGANRFDRPGEALFTARKGDRILGVCGLNCDPYIDSSQIGRVRRLYVMQENRRQGIGRTLVHQVIEVAKISFDRLHVCTTNPIAAQFYQSLGFMPCHSESATHTLNPMTTRLQLS